MLHVFSIIAAGLILASESDLCGDPDPVLLLVLLLIEVAVDVVFAAG